MDFTKNELLFLAGQFPQKTAVSFLTNIKADLLGTEAESLEKKGICREGNLTAEARELLEVIAGAGNAARILLQNQYAFIEKYVFRLGNKSVLVESNGEILALNPLVDLDRVLHDLAQFTGISWLKTVDLEIALLPEEMLSLLGLVDLYRKNALLFHAGAAELLEGATLPEILQALQNPMENSFIRILTKNYGYPLPPESDVEEILKKLASQGYLNGEKMYRLSDDLEVFAGNTLIPETLVLTEVLEDSPAGEIVVGGGLAVVIGLQNIVYFILEHDMLELNTLTGRQLLQVIENFLKCPDLSTLESKDIIEEKGHESVGPNLEEADAPATRGETVRETRFAALEEEYDRLNDLAQAGAISLEEFQEKVNALRLQDAAGIWWQLRSDGAWLKWDGANWTEAEPGQ